MRQATLELESTTGFHRYDPLHRSMQEYHPTPCYGGVVVSLLDGFLRGVDMSCQHPGQSKMNERCTTPVVECNEKAYVMSSNGRIKRKRRGTKKRGDSETDESDRETPRPQPIDRNQWKRIARLQARTNARQAAIRAGQAAARVKPRSHRSGTKGKEIRKYANGDSVDFAPTQLPPIIEIQESALSQDTLSFWGNHDDKKLSEELKSMLSQMSHDLSWVPSIEGTDETGNEDDKENSLVQRANKYQTSLILGKYSPVEMTRIKSADFEVWIDDDSGANASETEILLIEEKDGIIEEGEDECDDYDDYEKEEDDDAN